MKQSKVFIYLLLFLNIVRTTEILPLPDTIKSLFSKEKKYLDNTEDHEGRIRSFEHLEGNWATHISVPCEYSE
jgi:hypothetical protein